MVLKTGSDWPTRPVQPGIGHYTGPIFIALRGRGLRLLCFASGHGKGISEEHICQKIEGDLEAENC
ncbi:hypothetical protein PHJA_002806400 [Phtheirospermum japonicum]|uniref:Uncharacterized protein n=1 Tax=Phtheirospermum japonicum TaxID=374723 RepID=A0A830DF88_9LAMI|nr:hypothetical protein PHJA_002806400 [Phtheirospermum japonicum]